MIQTKVANGINKSEELLREAMSNTAPIYHMSQADKDNAASTVDASDSFGRQIYKHLMNGVSHMLPFVIGGGILIALAFLFDTFNPTNPSGFGSGTPLSAFLMKIGGASFWLYVTSFSRLHCYEYCRSSWSSSRFCGWLIS